MSILKQLSRFRKCRSGLAYVWTVAICGIIFFPIIVWPLNSALLMLEENIGYTFTGADAFALQVINVCTGYVLFFALVAITYESLIKSKAENAGRY